MIFAFNFKGADNFIRSLKGRYPSQERIAKLKGVGKTGLVEIDNRVYETITGL